MSIQFYILVIFFVFVLLVSGNFIMSLLFLEVLVFVVVMIEKDYNSYVMSCYLFFFGFSFFCLFPTLMNFSLCGKGLYYCFFGFLMKYFFGIILIFLADYLKFFYLFFYVFSLEVGLVYFGHSLYNLGYIDCFSFEVKVLCSVFFMIGLLFLTYSCFYSSLSNFMYCFYSFDGLISFSILLFSYELFVFCVLFNSIFMVLIYFSFKYFGYNKVSGFFNVWFLLGLPPFFSFFSKVFSFLIILEIYPFYVFFMFCLVYACIYSILLMKIVKKVGENKKNLFFCKEEKLVNIFFFNLFFISCILFFLILVFLF